jgi:hypothetical protein
MGCKLFRYYLLANLISLQSGYRHCLVEGDCFEVVL